MHSASRRIPAEPGMWVFILGDVMVFSLFFLTYVWYRGENPALYAASQRTLNEGFGAINTLFLLTSSWFVAAALNRARRGERKGASVLIALGMACGLGFVGVKIAEYHEKFAAGITILTDEFFMFYFMLTGIHFMHVLIGLAVLTYLFFALRKATPGAGEILTLEGGAVFWHLVDLLWVVLFALLYLMR